MNQYTSLFFFELYAFGKTLSNDEFDSCIIHSRKPSRFFALSTSKLARKRSKL